MKYAEPRLSAALTGSALQRLVKGLGSVPPNLFVDSAPNRHKIFVVEMIAGPVSEAWEAGGRKGMR